MAVDYREWEANVPQELRDDPLWRVQAYRLALFAADLGWEDVTILSRDKRTFAMADQLFRALGSVSANIAEGFSRASVREQARFYEYALGSARESRDWYYKARHVLGDDTIAQRLKLLTQIVRLLMRMVPERRSQAIKESAAPYDPDDNLA